MDYKYKYRKYKTKYLELLRGGEIKYYYEMMVNDFCNNTKDTYRNCESRNLNVISILDNDDYEFKIFKNSILYPENVKITSKHSGDFLNILTVDSSKIRLMEGFFGIKKKYATTQECTSIGLKSDACGLDVGTVVPKEKINVVFKEKTVDSTRDYDASKGKGKLNLNKVANILKEQGIKYIMLEAASQDGILVNLYKSYGFVILLNKWFKTYDFEVYPNENPLMFGHIDDIIRLTSQN